MAKHKDNHEIPPYPRISSAGIMAVSTRLPHFLLPQLSWKATWACPPLKQTAPSFARPIQQLAKPKYHAPSFQMRALYSSRATSGLPLQCQWSVFRSSPYATTGSRVGCFSTAQSLQRDHHFDTLKFVQRLRDEGFSEEQSKAMMLVLSDVIEESIQNLTRTMVLKEGAPHLLVLSPHEKIH